MKTRLHIERLVLEGIHVPVDGRGGLQAAVEAELSRLLAEGGVMQSLQGGGATPGISVNAPDLGNGSRPQPLGTRIARAIYKGIGQ